VLLRSGVSGHTRTDSIGDILNFFTSTRFSVIFLSSKLLIGVGSFLDFSCG